MSKAIKALGGNGLVIRSVSRFFATPCFPKNAGPDFVNAVVLAEYGGGPSTVLSALHQVEQSFGRERESRWSARTLDLDLIACDGEVLPDRATLRHWMDLPLEDQARIAPEQLVLPHPRMQDRAFVLVPMMDVAPDWVHPMLQKNVRDMVRALPVDEIRDVRPL